MPFALCSFGPDCGCGGMRNILIAGSASELLGTPTPQKAWLNSRSALTLLSTPPLPWDWTLSLTSLFLGCSTFSRCPFTMSEMNPHELMSAILFQRTRYLYLCSNDFILQSTSLLSREHLPGSSGRFNRTNANGPHDQLLSTQAKTNRNHLILSLAIINDFPYKPNKHKTFS